MRTCYDNTGRQRIAELIGPENLFLHGLTLSDILVGASMLNDALAQDTELTQLTEHFWVACAFKVIKPRSIRRCERH